MPSCPPAPHTLTAEETSAHLSVDALVGLSEEEARRRLAHFGPNRLREEKQEPAWKVFLEELRDPLVLLLLFTGALYALWGELADALTIFFVISSA
jgi:Ca2+-transporting ATPase